MLAQGILVLSLLGYCACAAPGRIVGGQNADFKEYPWQIMLKYDGYFYCGGTILDENNILTAAHCVDQDPAQDYGTFSIIAGEYDLSQNDGTEVEIEAATVVVHKAYDDWELYNDIAIIHLTEPLSFNDAIQPVPGLSDKQFDRDAKGIEEKCFTSGWGVFDEDTRDIPNVLQELPSTKVISNMKCNTKLSPWGFTVTRRMICTFDRNQGVCNGDSGGPMGCYDSEGVYRQIGIVSWGPSYYCSNGRQVFTRVSKYLDWIQANSI